MKLPERLKSLWNDERRRVDLLVAMGTAGLALLALSSFFPQETQETAPSAEASPADAGYTVQLEERLEALISQVDGAGRTRVMVTAAAGEETIYATDISEEGGGRQEQHVLLGSGGSSALVETTKPPQLLGVAVVCEGGGDPAVQLTITQLVQALTDVGASHITVTKMSS